MARKLVSPKNSLIYESPLKNGGTELLLQRTGWKSMPRIDGSPMQANAGSAPRRRLPLYLATAALLAVSLGVLLSRPPVVVRGSSTAIDPGPRPLPAAAGSFYSALTPNQSSITTRLTQIFTEVNFV